MGKSGPKMAIDRVTCQQLFGLPTRALCRGRPPSHWRPPLPGAGSKAATYPVDDSHQARVNEGRTEERGPVIQRINWDLCYGGQGTASKFEYGCFHVLWLWPDLMTLPSVTWPGLTVSHKRFILLLIRCRFFLRLAQKQLAVQIVFPQVRVVHV